MTCVRGGPGPKTVQQPTTNLGGSRTENGKFFRAALNFKSRLRKKPELMKVYEKIARGIWCYKGFFELVDAEIAPDGRRNVFKFHLKPVEKKPLGRIVEVPHARLLPTSVKAEIRQDHERHAVDLGWRGSGIPPPSKLLVREHEFVLT